MNIDSIRREYSGEELNEVDVNKDPIQQFNDWFQEASKSDIEDVNAMTLASCTPDGKPSARIVLLKNFDENGFTFFTSYESRKGNELNSNPFAAILFHWKELNRQIRIDGQIEKVSESESDTYFDSRPFESRISAIISPQSLKIDSRQFLEERQKKLKSNNSKIKRPSNWGGYRLVPIKIEFWQGQPNRLHDRIVYELIDNSWKISRLAP